MPIPPAHLMLDSPPIDLTELCEEHDWRFESVLKALETAGLSSPDARAYTTFCFSERAGTYDGRSNYILTDYQRAQLSIT